MKIGFDIISDLNLSPNSPFNWEGKATSLYCIVAGNVSPDVKTVSDVLTNIGNFYQGVFYIPGSLEYQDVSDIDTRTKELVKACKKIKNVATLYQHVVIIDGVAIVACNGWFGNTVPTEDTEEELKILQIDDLKYLKYTVEKIQRHLDVTKIVIVTNSIPNTKLYFGEDPYYLRTQIPPDIILRADTMKKVSHWVFGTHEKIVDTIYDDINYVNNPCFNRMPYWPKRIEVDA